MSERKGPFASSSDPDRTDEFPTIGSTQNVQQGPKRPQLPKLSSGQQGQHAQPKKRKFQRAQQQAPVQPQSQPVQAVAQPQQDPKDHEIEQLRQQLTDLTLQTQQLIAQQQAAAQNNVGSNQNSPAPVSQPAPQQQPQPPQSRARRDSVAIDWDEFCDFVREGSKTVNLKKAQKGLVRKVQEAARAVIKTDHYKTHLRTYCDDHGLEFDAVNDQIEFNRYLIDEYNDLKNAKDEKDPLADRVKFWVASATAIFALIFALTWSWAYGVIFGCIAGYIAWTEISGSGKFKRFVSCLLICTLPILGGLLVCAVVEKFGGSTGVQSVWYLAKSMWSGSGNSSKPKKEGEAGAPQGAPVGPPSGAPNVFPFVPERQSPPSSGGNVVRRAPAARRKTRKARRRSRPRSRRRRVRRHSRRSRSRWSGSAMIRSTKWTRIGRTSKRVHSLCFSKRVASVRVLIKGSRESIASGRFVRRPGCKSAYLFFTQQSGSIYVYASGSYPLRVRISR